MADSLAKCLADQVCLFHDLPRRPSSIFIPLNGSLTSKITLPEEEPLETVISGPIRNVKEPLYKKLIQDEFQIRLLTLEPDLYAGFPKCTLCIESMSEEEDYEALSYDWGEDPGRKQSY